MFFYSQLSGSIFTSEPPRSDLGWIGLMDVRELMKEFAKYTKCEFKDIYFWGFFYTQLLGSIFTSGFGRIGLMDAKELAIEDEAVPKTCLSFPWIRFSCTLAR